MATWDPSYEAQPKNFNNPGYGAQQIRKLKTNIREREAIEHIWEMADTDLAPAPDGTHKEGSARVLVLDSDSSNRTYRLVDSEPGRVRVDFQPRSVQRKQDGNDDWAGKDSFFAERELILDVMADDGSGVAQPGWHNLFSADNFVDVVHDQTINGAKDFTLSPRVPLIEATKFNSGEALSDDEKRYAVSLEDVRDRLKASAYNNMFDPSGLGNPEEAAANPSYNHISNVLINGVAYTIVDADMNVSDIVAESITASVIKGVVWV